MKKAKAQASIEFMLLLCALLMLGAASVSGLKAIHEGANQALCAQHAKALAQRIEEGAKTLSFFGKGSSISISQKMPECIELTNTGPKIILRAGQKEFGAQMPPGIALETREETIMLTKSAQ